MKISQNNGTNIENKYASLFQEPIAGHHLFSNLEYIVIRINFDTYALLSSEIKYFFAHENAPGFMMKRLLSIDEISKG